MSLDDIVDDDEDDSSSSSAREYVQPTREEFEEFLESTDYEWIIEERATTKEIVYETHDVMSEYSGKVIRIYSTIDERTNKARSKGADAIRLLLWDKHINKPIGGRKKTLRITTWRKNLREKIESLAQEWEDTVTFCDECGDMMVIREGKYGEFLGCRNYPECENTEQIKDE